MLENNMNNPKPTFGKFIQRKIGRSIFTKADKGLRIPPSNTIHNKLIAIHENNNTQIQQPMECKETLPVSVHVAQNRFSESFDVVNTFEDTFNPSNLFPHPNGSEPWIPLFISTASEQSSSAPASPVSAANHQDSPLGLTTKRPLPSVFTQPPPITITRSMRTNNQGLRSIRLPPSPSPYHSDMSQSAPSSPNTSCYEQLPLVKYAAVFEDTEDEYDKVMSSAENFTQLETTVQPNRAEWSSNFVRNVTNQSIDSMLNTTIPRLFRRGPFTQSYRGSIQKPPLIPLNPQSFKQQDLRMLLRKLGLESLHQCLVQNGYCSIDQLGGLTRRRLIEMGISNAEMRASLLTAAQLLGTPFDANAPSSQQVQMKNRMQSIGAWSSPRQPSFHDSGIYSSGNDASVGMTASAFQPSSNQGRPFQPCADSRIPGNILNGYHQTLDRTPQANRRGKLNENTPLDNGNPVSVVPFGQRKNGKFYRSLSLGPKPLNQSDQSNQSFVWLGEEDLNRAGNSGSSETRWYREQMTSQEANPFSGPKMPVGILRKVSAVTQGNEEKNTLPRNKVTSPPKSVKIDETSLEEFTNSSPRSMQLLENQISECLRLERIDLIKSPYSTQSGESGIPLRLIERYACESKKDFNSVAVTLEVIRERHLRKAGLSVTSNLEEIRSQRYLNCNGIKTDNLTDFLVSIGLPMYAECLANALQGHSPTPGNLRALTDAQMVYGLDIPVTHVTRIRQEAALIPKSILVSTSKRLHHRHHQLRPSPRPVFSEQQVTPNKTDCNSSPGVVLDMERIFDKV